MKKGWDKYASKKRLVQKGYFRKYSDRNSGREAYKASSSNSVFQSGKEQEEIKKELVFIGEEHAESKLISEESSIAPRVDECRLSRSKRRKSKNSSRKNERVDEEKS